MRPAWKLLLGAALSFSVELGTEPLKTGTTEE